MTGSNLLKSLLAVAVLATGGLSRAEITDVADGGFTSVNTARVDATPEHIYKSIIDIGMWWHPDHTYWGNAANLYLKPELGGFFGENKPDGQGAVRHAEVIWLDPDRGLCLQGAFGPLQEHALSAVLTITFAPAANDTTDAKSSYDLTFKYAVGGYVPDGLTTWAPTVDGVLSQQLDRLQTYIKTGAAPKKSD